MASSLQFLVIFLCGLLIVPTQGAINMEDCGIKGNKIRKLQKRIVGGKSAGLCQFPWAVTVLNIAAFYTACNGAILDEIHVVTVASCLFKKVEGKFVVVHPTDLNVFYGSSVYEPRSTSLVVNIAVHKKFNQSTLENNIAILTLTEELDFSFCLGPVCVSNSRKNPRKFRKCFVMGWGTTSADGTKNAPIMNWMNVSLPKQKYCRMLYGKRPKTLCAWANNKALCKDDSGAPLVCKGRKGRFYLVGLATDFNYLTCNSKFDLYTDVGKYYKWIDSKTEWYRVFS